MGVKSPAVNPGSKPQCAALFRLSLNRGIKTAASNARCRNGTGGLEKVATGSECFRHSLFPPGLFEFYFRSKPEACGTVNGLSIIA